MDPLALGRLGLLLIRPGLLLVATPPFSGVYTPSAIKIGLSLLIAVGMLPVVTVPPAMGGAALAVIVAREVLVGLSLSMAVQVLLAGAELAGQLAGFQLGFAYAAVVDPQTGARNPVLATAYSGLAVFTFLAINGHHALLRALARSYQAVPLGLGHVDGSTAWHIARLLGIVFIVGAQLAAPIVVVLVMVELALGVLTRVAPALNLLVLGFPVRLIVGLVALAGALTVVPGVVRAVMPSAFELAMRLAGAFR